jgi:hypothetical protein
MEKSSNVESRTLLTSLSKARTLLDGSWFNLKPGTQEGNDEKETVWRFNDSRISYNNHSVRIRLLVVARGAI